MVKTLDLSPNGMGLSVGAKVSIDVIRQLLSKCGPNISQIIYDDIQLNPTFGDKLPKYISKYSYNVTTLNLTATDICPSKISILARNCKKIKKLGLRLSSACRYERNLTMLYQQNEDLEDIALYRKSLCRSLLNLPEHKMRAIKLVCEVDLSTRRFSSVSEI